MVTVLAIVTCALTVVLVLIEPPLIIRFAPRRVLAAVLPRIESAQAAAIVRLERSIADGLAGMGRDLDARFQEVRKALNGDLDSTYVSVAQRLEAAVPKAEDIQAAAKAAVGEVLAANRPDPAAMAKMQEEQRQALGKMMRSELEAVLADFQGQQEQLAMEDAASMMGRKGADSRLTFAAMEEQFHAQVMKAAGDKAPIALIALEEAQKQFPNSYKLMVRQGARSIPAFFEKAGIQAGGAGAAQGAGAVL